MGITHVDVMGLATDYCVKATAEDAIALGYKTRVLAFASRAVNLRPDDEKKALSSIRAKGCDVVMSLKDWETGMPTKTETLFETRYLALKRRGHWVYGTRPNCQGAVGIIAITEDNKVILVEQFRIPMGKPVIELPAGLRGDEIAGETAIDAARKELLEETGYSHGHFEQFGTPVCSSAGFSDETIQLFVATGIKKTADGGGVGSENIVIHEVPLRDYTSWLLEQQAKGKITDSKTFAVPGILLHLEMQKCSKT